MKHIILISLLYIFTGCTQSSMDPIHVIEDSPFEHQYANAYYDSVLANATTSLDAEFAFMLMSKVDAESDHFSICTPSGDSITNNPITYTFDTYQESILTDSIPHKDVFDDIALSLLERTYHGPYLVRMNEDSIIARDPSLAPTTLLIFDPRPRTEIDSILLADPYIDVPSISMTESNLSIIYDRYCHLYNTYAPQTIFTCTCSQRYVDDQGSHRFLHTFIIEDMVTFLSIINAVHPITIIHI